MTFLQPLALLGLFIAAIPPLLHLIARRVPPLVMFPALRYLTETERRQSRRLKLRNLLLMILRTLAIALIAFAASRPVARFPFGDQHEPTAIAMVLDNSMSSGAVVDGRRVLDDLIERARRVLNRVGPNDRLLVVLADGIPQRITEPELRQLLDTLAPRAVRLDIAQAVQASSRALSDQIGLGQEILLISDLQATAFSSGNEGDGRVLVWREMGASIENRSIDSARVQPAVWLPHGEVIGVVGGTSPDPATVRLVVGEESLARSFGASGDRVVLSGSTVPGWHTARLEIDPDEFRADDRRQLALFVAPPTGVASTSGVGSFVTDALEVMRSAQRVGTGSQVTLTDAVIDGRTVLFPPADPALIGAVNRNLERRGITWRFGEEVRGEWTAPDSAGAPGATVFRRRRIEGTGDVIRSLAGDPWIVRDRDVVLVGTRFDPAWTSLPVTASFIPFLDELINRVAARQIRLIDAAPGQTVDLPTTVAGLVAPDGSVMPLEASRVVAPLTSGVYFLRGSAGDTIGALQVNHDARESRLEPAGVRAVEAALGSATEVLDGGGIDRELFRGARRADLTGLIALSALLVVVAELLVATLGGGRQTDA